MMEKQEMLDLFWEIHSGNPREGPGEFQSTKRAFDMLEDLPSSSKILDIGCGPGMQTIDLGRLADGIIIAVDNHPQFLNDLKRKAQQDGLADRIIPNWEICATCTLKPEHLMPSGLKARAIS